MTNLEPRQPEYQIAIYQTEDGATRMEVRFEGDTAWLSQKQMADIFQTTPQNITIHVRAIYDDGELDEQATCKQFLQVQTEGTREVRRYLNFYNLDMILAVGYKVRSHRGVEFRRWATERLRELLVKGFTLDDEKLKEAGGGAYFDELLARIRDIRSSEKVFWRKVLEIYATSMDYDPRTEMSKQFFATIQNKIHYAAHGYTAAEIISSRADASLPNMGLTSWAAAKPRKTDAEIAKNYLNHQELDALNRIVTVYLEFAELQALNRKPMYMRDWIGKLDEFLRMSGREVLEHAGRVTHDEALRKAREEFEQYRAEHLNDESPVERHFQEVVEELKTLEAKKPRAPRKKKA